ncbi:hypothetical protein [Mucilaginibacter koreensis]
MKKQLLGIALALSVLGSMFAGCAAPRHPHHPGPPRFGQHHFRNF